jgi:hypothetical protein
MGLAVLQAPGSELTFRLGVVPADDGVQGLEQEGELKDCHDGVIGSAPSVLDGNLRGRCRGAVYHLVNFGAARRRGVAVLHHD